MPFTGKRYLVTGAASGIGAGVCDRLVKSGAEVIALDVSADGLANLAESRPGLVTIHQDVADWSATKDALKDLPALNGLVNCAGVQRIVEGFFSATEIDFNKIFAVNVNGTVCVSQCVAQNMLSHSVTDDGSIVNISSIASKNYYPKMMPYSASKAAVESITRTMAKELGARGIRVNAVGPYLVPATSMGARTLEALKDDIVNVQEVVPLGRFPFVKEVVDAVMYLLGDESTFVNGIVMSLDGGESV